MKSSTTRAYDFPILPVKVGDWVELDGVGLRGRRVGCVYYVGFSDLNDPFDDQDYVSVRHLEGDIYGYRSNSVLRIIDDPIELLALAERRRWPK